MGIQKCEETIQGVLKDSTSFKAPGSEQLFILLRKTIEARSREIGTYQYKAKSDENPSVGIFNILKLLKAKHKSDENSNTLAKNSDETNVSSNKETNDNNVLDMPKDLREPTDQDKEPISSPEKIEEAALKIGLGIGNKILRDKYIENPRTVSPENSNVTTSPKKSTLRKSKKKGNRVTFGAVRYKKERPIRKQQSNRNDRLLEDKVYLAILSKGIPINPGLENDYVSNRVRATAEDALNFLETRNQFWDMMHLRNETSGNKDGLSFRGKACESFRLTF